MPVSALIGLQWGDEGKGKVVDAISPNMDWIVRAQGGANAGHTVSIGSQKHVLHLIPSGMLYPNVRGVIGNGVVLDPFQLLKEIDALSGEGHEVADRMFIANRAHLVLPYHKAMDEALETLRGGSALGTTKRGIGPTYMDKAARDGIRAGDLKSMDTLSAKVRRAVDTKNQIFSAMKLPTVNGESILEQLRAGLDRLRPMVTDTVALLHRELEQDRNILLEGAQGILLDLDLGTYPFVTSSNCHLGGLLAGSGLPPSCLSRVIGVSKAYCTRVGSGPFPTEDEGVRGQLLRDRGNEYGSTTGRPRRCGWLDLVALRYAIRINGVTEIALTKSDVLATVGSIKVAHAYERGSVVMQDFPAGDGLSEVRPNYTEYEGFEEDIGQIHSFEDLPEALRELVRVIEAECKATVSIVSTGPNRQDTILRN